MLLTAITLETIVSIVWSVLSKEISVVFLHTHFFLRYVSNQILGSYFLFAKHETNLKVLFFKLISVRTQSWIVKNTYSSSLTWIELMGAILALPHQFDPESFLSLGYKDQEQYLP